MHRQTSPPKASKATSQLAEAQVPSVALHPLTNSVPGPAEVPWRIREIAMLRGLGYSYREIARPLGVSPQAVSIMLSRHRRSIKSLEGAMELGNLSPRAVNALARHGIRTREEARRGNVLDLLQNARNCGRKTIEEIARWIDSDLGTYSGDVTRAK